MQRNIFKYLESWKESSARKVLLLRGARQVGKTYIVRELGKTFKNFIEINLLEDPKLLSLFSSGSLNPDTILSSLSAIKGVNITDEDTLLFIDEIQESPEAITSLRFFYEKRPRLHVIATGSLLDFALENTQSFGVGRIENLFMYAMNFEEFLRAMSEDILLERIKSASILTPLPQILHERALSLFKTYLTVGGMPEIVHSYISNSNFISCYTSLGNILTGYEDDFIKYKNRLSLSSIQETFKSCALQASKKFVYSHAFRDASSRTVQQALDVLVKAGVVHKIFHSDANQGSTLGGEIDLKKFKTLIHDVGLYNILTGVQLKELALLDPLELITKGSLVETACGLLLLSHENPQNRGSLFYWHREAKSSNAEVDYVINLDSTAVPIEVKSSGKGAMHSMRSFLKSKHLDTGIRVSTENISRYGDIVTVPIYAVGEISRIVRG